MQSSEYEDILESMQKIVRQSYDLGRAEALKQVVEVLKNDALPPKPLALAAPTPAVEPDRTEPTPAMAAHDATATPDAPPKATPDAPPKAMPDASADVLDTPAKTPDAPARDEKKPSRPWWSR